MPINSVALSNTFNEFRTTVNEVITTLNDVSGGAGEIDANTLIGGTVTANNLTSGRVIFATVGGRLIDDSRFLYDTSTDVLTLDGTSDSTTANTGTLRVTGGVGIAKNLFVGSDLKVEGITTFAGNVFFLGSNTSISTVNIEVNDPMLHLANNNITDVVDIGFHGQYNQGAANLHSGLFRDASDDTWKLFRNYNIEPAPAIDIANNGFAWANLSVGTLTAANGVNITTGQTYKINGTAVLSTTTLGSGVTASSLNSVGTLTSLTVSGNATLGDSASADVHTINGATTLSANSADAALRINQIGAGNALLVEDSANPDASPFVIDANGRVIVGNTAPSTAISGITPYVQIFGDGIDKSAIGVFNYNNSVNGSFLTFSKSRSGTIASETIVQSGDNLMTLRAYGSDGVAPILAAQIRAEVDGTPGANNMPSRLTFGTTPAGSLSVEERIRITSAGKIGFATSAPASTVHVAGNTILSNVNVLNASYDSVSFSVTTEEISPTDLFFSPDGLKMYIVGATGDDVNQYNLSTPWVVSSAVFATNFSVAGQDTSPQGLFFRPDGHRMYVLGGTNDTVFQYTLITPWSLATANYDFISYSVTTQEATPTGISFKPNGLSMYVVGNTGDAVYQYTLSTAWDVSSATFLQSFSVSGQEGNSTGLAFTGDGSRMFVIGTTGDDVNVYNLTTPWDISTSAFVNVFSVAGQDLAPQGIYIKPDGTKMYMVGSTNDTVYQYTVPSIDIQLTGQTSVAALDVHQDLNVYGILSTGAVSASANVVIGGLLSTRNVFVSNGSRVGIGTLSPASILHVNGVDETPTIIATRTTNSATAIGEALYLRLNDNVGAGGMRNEIGMGYGTPGTQTYTPSVIGYVQTAGTANTYGDIYFATRSVTTDTAPTERMRIVSSGFVGIGTSSPSSTLHVVGGLTVSGNVVFSSTGALKIPSGNTAQQAGFTTVGMVRFNTTTDALEVYKSTGWASAGGGATSSIRLFAAGIASGGSLF
jgi:sugar lactone lactonase YvrE